MLLGCFWLGCWTWFSNKNICSSLGLSIFDLFLNSELIHCIRTVFIPFFNFLDGFQFLWQCHWGIIVFVKSGVNEIDICAGMLEFILVFSARYAGHRNYCFYHPCYHHFPIQVHYWIYHQYELLKKKNLNQSIQLVMEWNQNLFSWSRLLCILICFALSSVNWKMWYGDFFLQVKWM